MSRSTAPASAGAAPDELFERYCARSVAGQTRPVTWIIYFDPESPSWLLERLAPLVDRGLFRPILRASVSREELLSDIAESLTSPGRHLVTTNLANDDGLAIDFSERVTSANARTTGPSSTSRGAWSRALGACSCAGIR
jgi:hypothetical protein